MSFWNKSFILASGNQFLSIFQIQISFFPSSANLFLQQILYSGQWKLIFWLVETLLFKFLKYPIYWKQFFHLMKIYFNRILYYGQWQRIFVEPYSFIHIFFGSSTVIRGRPTFKNILFLLVETVFFNFFQTLIQMEAVFWSTEILFFSESFILASGNGF